MPRVLLFVIFVVTFPDLIKGTIIVAETPRLIGESSESKHVGAGENFSLECESDRPIFWFYPQLTISVEEGRELWNYSTLITISNSTSSGGLFRSTLHVQSANFLDTGYYSCMTDETAMVNDTENAASIYVYVKDLEHLLVTNDSFIILSAKQYQPVVIPCRPTTLEAEVSLFKDGIELHVGEQEDHMNVEYDPTIGFTLQSINMKDIGAYSCTAEHGDVVEEIHCHLDVLMVSTTIPKPSINDSAVHPVIAGETLYLECLGMAYRGIKFSITWQTPNENSQIHITDPIPQRNCGKGTYVCHMSTLTIRDVKHEDAGNYTCTVKDHNEVTNRDTQEVKVHDPGVDLIDLKDDGLNFTVPAGAPNVTWVIHVDASSRPTFQWFNQLDQDINSDSSIYTHKYNMTLTKGYQQVMLVIYKVTIQDAGSYKFLANLNSVTRQLNLTLYVKDKPAVFIGGYTELYYNLGATYDMECRVVGYPQPEIQWSFMSCDNMEDCNETNYKIIKNVPDPVLDNRKQLISKLSFKVTESGILKCHAKNTEGDHNETVAIFATDIPQQGSFPSVWRKSEDEVVEGDVVKIYCGTTKYNYSSDIWWYLKRTGYQDKVQIQNQSDVHFITRNDSAYSYISELTLLNVRMGSDANYTCAVKRQDDAVNEYKETVVNILASMVPKVSSSNLNGTDMMVNTGSIVRLFCKAKGLPRPTVMWYKNENPVLNDSRIRVEGDEMTIQFAKLDDEGEYKCDISNRYGRLSRNMHLKFRDKPGLHVGLIVGITVCGIILVIMIVVLVSKIRRERKLQEELNVAGLANFVQGAMESINPEMPVDEQAELLPYDKKWEFPRDKLKLGKQLGAGAFGVVMKGEAWGILDGEMKTIVAVKMVKRNADRTYIKALASELKIMIHLGKHLNVVNLVGACTKNLARMELLVIVEYCRFGNLHNYLLRHREEFVDQIDPRTGEIDPTIGTDVLSRTESMRSNSHSGCRSDSGGMPVDYRAACPDQSSDPTAVDTEMNLISLTPTGEQDGCMLSNNSVQPEWRSNYKGDYKGARPICTRDLLCWAFQVARGMEYLASRKVLHGDLAARNILLADENIVKICDFGLAKSMYKSDNYRKKGDGPLPVKWMAIESIRDRVFSTQSDVWSFGIVLWEFFSLARTPYPGMEADEKLYNKLVDGYRMEKPEHATVDIYGVMLNCWEVCPVHRPSFTDLAERLGGMLEDSVRRHYIDLNDPYMDMNAQWLQGLENDYLSMMNAPTYGNMVSPTRDDEDSPSYVNSPRHMQTTSEGADGSGYLCMKSPLPEEAIFSPRRKESNIFRFSPHLQNQRRLKKEEADGVDGPEQKPMLKEGRNNSESDIEMDDMEKGASKKEDRQRSDRSDRSEPPEVKVTSFSNPSYQSVPIPITPSDDNYVNMPQQKTSKYNKRNPSESLSTNTEFSDLYPSPSNLSGGEPMKLMDNELNSNKSPLNDVKFQNSFSNPNYQSQIKTHNDGYVNVPNNIRRASDASSGFQSDVGENILVN